MSPRITLSRYAAKTAADSDPTALESRGPIELCPPIRRVRSAAQMMSRLFHSSRNRRRSPREWKTGAARDWFPDIRFRSPWRGTGPIVMNTQEQLQKAFAELREGTFLSANLRGVTSPARVALHR